MRVLLGFLGFAVVCTHASDVANGSEVLVDPRPEWSGLYLGVFGAYGIGQTNSSDGADSRPQDPFLGLNAGYMVEHDDFVFGLEGEASLADLDDDFGAGAGFVSQDIDNIAAIRALVGLQLGDGLFYATGGWSWAISERSTLTASDKMNLNGPSVGIGYRYAVNGNWAVRLEYTHYNYGAVTYDIPGTPRVDSNINVVRVGAEFRFQ